MQALIELLAGFIALLLAVALSQFGVDIERPQRASPEVHRVNDCGQPAATGFIAAPRDRKC